MALTESGASPDAERVHHRELPRAESAGSAAARRLELHGDGAWRLLGRPHDAVRHRRLASAVSGVMPDAALRPSRGTSRRTCRAVQVEQPDRQARRRRPIATEATQRVTASPNAGSSSIGRTDLCGVELDGPAPARVAVAPRCQRYGSNSQDQPSSSPAAQRLHDHGSRAPGRWASRATRPERRIQNRSGLGVLFEDRGRPAGKEPRGRSRAAARGGPAGRAARKLAAPAGVTASPRGGARVAFPRQRVGLLGDVDAHRAPHDAPAAATQPELPNWSYQVPEFVGGPLPVAAVRGLPGPGRRGGG